MSELDKCKYCQTPIEPIEGYECECDGARIANLEAQLEAAQEDNRKLREALEAGYEALNKISWRSEQHWISEEAHKAKGVLADVLIKEVAKAALKEVDGD